MATKWPPQNEHMHSLNAATIRAMDPGTELHDSAVPGLSIAYRGRAKVFRVWARYRTQQFLPVCRVGFS